MTNQVLAYIDPGSGSLIIQMVVGCAVGLGLFFRQNVMRVLKLFRRAS